MIPRKKERERNSLKRFASCGSLEIWMRARRKSVQESTGFAAGIVRFRSNSPAIDQLHALFCASIFTPEPAGNDEKEFARGFPGQNWFRRGQNPLYDPVLDTVFSSRQYQRLIVGRVMRITPFLFIFFFFFSSHLLFRGIPFGKIKSAKINRRLSAWLRYLCNTFLLITKCF